MQKIEVINCKQTNISNFILYSKSNSNILYAPIYLDTFLPNDGWIQGCILCNANTLNNIFYIDDTYDNIGYMVYCCRTCKRSIDKYEDVKNEYCDLILDYIDTYKDIIHENAIKINNKLN